MFEKIWKDPVWSKVISAGILAVISLVFIWIKSLWENISFEESFYLIIEFKVKLIYVIAIMVSLLMIYYLVIKARKKEERFYTKRQKEFMKNHSQLDFGPKGIIARFQTLIDEYDVPFIINLATYCKSHGKAPIKFNKSCPLPECKNENITFSEEEMTNIIESVLLFEYDKFLGKVKPNTDEQI